MKDVNGSDLKDTGIASLKSIRNNTNLQEWSKVQQSGIP